MPTTEELLARSAQEKLRTGQKPNKTELNALENMKNAAAMERLRSVSPRFFNELFGFTGNKSRFDWEKQYDIPCGQGRKTINMYDVFTALRQLIANNRKYIGSGSAKPGELTDDQIDLLEAKRREVIERRKKLEKQNAELELRRSEYERRLIPIEDVRDCFDSLVNIWTRASKQIQKVNVDAWEILEANLLEAREVFDNEMTIPTSQDDPKPN